MIGPMSVTTKGYNRASAEMRLTEKSTREDPRSTHRFAGLLLATQQARWTYLAIFFNR
jgi:hypothetical protein